MPLWMHANFWIPYLTSFWDTLTPYHICPKILTPQFYYIHVDPDKTISYFSMKNNYVVLVHLKEALLMSNLNTVSWRNKKFCG